MPDKHVFLEIGMDALARRIAVVRGQRVMLANDLASLYQVTTGNLNLAVRRNAQPRL
jgi:hypothetical protein